MIVLVVKIELQKGKKAEFIKTAKPLIEGSKKEEGNIEYNLYHDLEDENAMAFIEKWKDEKALEFHEKTEHFVNHFPKLQNLCAKPLVINSFNVVDI